MGTIQDTLLGIPLLYQDLLGLPCSSQLVKLEASAAPVAGTKVDAALAKDTFALIGQQDWPPRVTSR